MESRYPFAGSRDLGESFTDIYTSIMLLLFPLFPGFSGYLNITASKFFFFVAVTAIWIVSIVMFCIIKRPTLSERFSLPQYLALAFILVVVLSWAFSPYRSDSFLGAGRYDGLLSLLLYIIIFLGVSLFTYPKLLHFKFLSFSLSLCMLLSLLQLFGCNPFHLFPSGLSFFDSNLSYSGVFLGTIGNMNIYDAVLCLAIPTFFSLYLCEECPGFLLPVLLSVPVLLKASGDGAKLSLGMILLVIFPVFLVSLPRVRRLFRGSSLILFMAGLSSLWQPTSLNPFAFRLSSACILLFAFGLILFSASFLPFSVCIHVSPQKLRRLFLLISVTVLLAGFLFVFFSDGEFGAISELHDLLHGHVKDSFGSSRIRIWRECLRLVKERPLLGGGPGTAALRLDIFFSRFVPETGRTLSSYVDNPHNIYLAYLVNCGALGLLCYCLLLLCLAWRLFSKRSSTVSVSCAIGVLACAIHEFFGLGLCLSEPLFWIMLGFLCPAVFFESSAEVCSHEKQEANNHSDFYSGCNSADCDTVPLSPPESEHSAE